MLAQGGAGNTPEAFGEAAVSMRISPREHSRDVSRRASSPFGEFATTSGTSLMIAAASHHPAGDGAPPASAVATINPSAMDVSGLGGSAIIAEGRGSSTLNTAGGPADVSSLNPKSSELADIDDEVQRRMNVHSSSAASRPRQVMFHQSPPPSRQRLD